MDLVAAALHRDVLAEGVVAAIEVAEMVGRDAEEAGNADHKFGRFGGCDVNADIGEGERGSGKRSTRLRIPSEPGQKEGRGRQRERVIDGQVFDRHAVAAAVSGEDVPVADGNIGRLIEAGPEKAAADLLFAGQTINFSEPLFIILHQARTRVCELAIGPVWQRNFREQGQARSAKAAHGNLVARERHAGGRVFQRGRDGGKVAGALGGSGDE